MTKQTWKGAQHPPVLRRAHAGASEMSLHVLHTLDSQEKDRCCQNAERREPCAWWLGRQSVQPLWKTVWSFLKKLKTELPHDPAIPLQGMYPKKKLGPHTRMCTLVFCSIVPSSRMWPQPGCLSIDKCTKEMPDTHTQWSLTQPLKKGNPSF